MISFTFTSTIRPMLADVAAYAVFQMMVTPYALTELARSF